MSVYVVVFGQVLCAHVLMNVQEATQATLYIVYTQSGLAPFPGLQGSPGMRLGTTSCVKKISSLS